MIKKLNTFVKKPLGQSGMFHYLAPLIVVVMFGVLGAAYFVMSHAATPTPELRVGSTPGGTSICLTAQSGDGVTAMKCDGAIDQRWTATAQTIRNTALAGGPWCIGANGTVHNFGVHVATCNGTAAQGWGYPTWSGAIPHALYSYGAYPSQKDCLVDPSGALGGTLEGVGCGTQAELTANAAYQDQVWNIQNYTAASTGGGGNGGGGTTATAGSRILAQAEKFNDIWYLYGGGHGGWSSFYKNCLGSGKYQPYSGNTACEVDCSGLVSMATDMAMGTSYDWTVNGGAMQGAGSGHWHGISVNSVQPGDIVTASEHVEFVVSGTGSHIATFGAHETGQRDGRLVAGHTFQYSAAYRYE